jgi:hypothetical protein
MGGRASLPGACFLRRLLLCRLDLGGCAPILRVVTVGGCQVLGSCTDHCKTDATFTIANMPADPDHAGTRFIHRWGDDMAALKVRVRMEMVGAQKCRNVGESQPVLSMTDPIISPRTRMWACSSCSWAPVAQGAGAHGAPLIWAARRLQAAITSKGLPDTLLLHEVGGGGAEGDGAGGGESFVRVH